MVASSRFGLSSINLISYSVVPWGDTVHFFKLSIEVAAVVVTDIRVDVFYSKGGVGQQIGGLLHTASQELLLKIFTCMFF